MGTGLLSQQSLPAQPAPFVNFETAPVHPVDLSPDGLTLAVCNLPDYRIELFDVSSGIPHSTGDVPVGIDPVSARWRTTNELWVVNYISSTVNVVDVARRLIIATLQTRSGPADLVFAGTPARAYVSCARDNVVQVFDPISHVLVTNLAVKGDRPKAMAVSPDGSRAYVAIFESGNASTILAPKLTPLDVRPGPSVVAHPEGPHHGQDPPPNRGTNFYPAIAPYLDPNTLPRGSHIVKKNEAGHWMDDNAGDWTEFVSGSKAAESGRVAGWDMPDLDLGVIDTSTHAVTYAKGLMNLCMALAVNPVSGRVAVVGTDGKNEVRFEPNLRGVFLRVNLALVEPDSLGKTIRDLNPHLDYDSASIPIGERAKSLGDPRGIVWNSTGTRAYVTGMGSHNLVILDADGQRGQSESIELGEGPTGLALNEARGRLYVPNRFSASLSVVDLASLTVLTNVPFFDPTPEFIKKGRRHFYDTRLTSGLGHVSCASCHPDGRFDRLAWDLGIPNGEMFNSSAIPIPDYFHPMKGPMVTRTLQDPIARAGQSLMHWRGDRDSVLDFHVTFTDLLAADRRPSVSEMLELERFFSSMTFPPNRFRTLDNKLSEDLPLPGHYGLASNASETPPPLPNGNARRGFQRFVNKPDPEGPDTPRNIACFECHDCQSGRGIEQPHISSGRTAGLAFTGAPLRGLDEKIGFDMQSMESRAGFGFFHDGRADTLVHFLSDGFGMTNNQDIADMIALLLSFSGGGEVRCGGDSSHSVPDPRAGVGRQVTLTTPTMNEALSNLVASAENGDYGDGVIARGMKNGIHRSWAGLTDRNGEFASIDDWIALASPETPVTFTVAYGGTGQRVGIDRDDDGVFDRTEIEMGSDLLDIHSPSTLPPPELSDFVQRIDIFAMAGQNLDFSLSPEGRWRGSTFVALHPNNVITFEIIDPQEAPPGASIQAGGTRLVWAVPSTQQPQCWEIRLRAYDNARPASSESGSYIRLCVINNPFRIRITTSPFGDLEYNSNDVQLVWEYRFDVQRYEIQTSDWPAGPWETSGFVHGTAFYDRSPSFGRRTRFYRIVASE